MPPPQYDAEIEYLESTGTQWIDSEIKATNDIGISISGSMLDRTSGQFPVMVGTQLTDWSKYISIYQDNNTVSLETYNGTSDSMKSLNCPVSSTFEGKINWLESNTIVLKYQEKEFSSACTVPNLDFNIGIFCAISENGPESFSKSHIISFSISKGSTIVRDFIPVRKNGIGYLYDKVSKKLFGNSGTGDFVLGPDKN